MTRVVLISTYELGRQPFGLASPAAWLRRIGAEVTCMDLTREKLRVDVVRRAGLIGIYVPMHTATRLAASLAPRLKAVNPAAKLCFYGLYAPVNETYLRELGADFILGGEFEGELAKVAQSLGNGTSYQPPTISLSRQEFLAPERGGLRPLADYAKLSHPDGEARIVGYTEASRGCKHLCRHCPIVPVYGGAFRIVQRDVVLEDIRRQVAAGARHITFGDPDFFNGPAHAVKLVEDLHREHPGLTYDVTIKVEHLLKHAGHLATLARTGCLFVTTAAESFDDRVLARLAKGHTFVDFRLVAERFKEIGLVLSPTFVPFTPWTTLDSYREFLQLLVELDLVESVAPIQLAIRLLIPARSRLLELPEIASIVEPFNPKDLCYPWKHPDPVVERLCDEARRAVHDGEKKGQTRWEIFATVWSLAHGRPLTAGPLLSRAAIPYLQEPWYC